MRSVKKTVGILLSLVLTLALAFQPVCAVAEENEVVQLENGFWGDLFWAYYSNGTMLITGNGAMEEFPNIGQTPWAHLESKVNTIQIQEGVTTIAADAFFCFTNLAVVTLPNSLTQIGSSAFFGCSSLTWILDENLEQKLPDKVTTLQMGAFCGCSSLQTLSLGKGVTRIENSAFSGCTALTQITLPDALTYIDAHAFFGCYQLKSISFPEKVNFIGDNAFGDCYSIKEISFSGNAPEIHSQAFASSYDPVKATVFYPGANTTWTAAKRTNYGGQLTWKAKAQDCVATGACGENLVWTLSRNGVLTIKGTGKMYDYDTINYPPWYGYADDITSVVIEPGVTTIGETAFYKCIRMKTVSIPDSVTSYGRSSFFDCQSLQTLHIGANVTTIGEFALVGCDNLTEFTVAAGNLYFTADSRGCLYNKAKTLLIQVPETITGHYTIPEGVTQIGTFAFDGCVLLTGVTIPQTVKTIGNSTFSCCFKLQEVTIPQSVTFIDHAAFWYCSSLKKIAFVGDAPVFGDDVFVKVEAVATYPAGNRTWTQDKFVHNDSNITWVAVQTENPGTDPDTPVTNPTEPDAPVENPTDPTDPDAPVISPTDPEEPDVPVTDPTAPTDPDIPGTQPTDPENPDTPVTQPSESAGQTKPSGEASSQPDSPALQEETAQRFPWILLIIGALIVLVAAIVLIVKNKVKK